VVVGPVGSSHAAGPHLRVRSNHRATTSRILRPEAVIPEARQQHGSLPPFCLSVLIVLEHNAVQVT